jgi:hypothetical protein
MAGKSSIEWTEATGNPVTGCSKISPGCKHCYVNRLALRLQAIGQPNYRNGFEVTLHPHTLEIPLGWRKSRTIFVNSMSDVFHEPGLGPRDSGSLPKIRTFRFSSSSGVESSKSARAGCLMAGPGKSFRNRTNKK